MRYVVVNGKGKVIGRYAEEALAIEDRDYVIAHGGQARVIEVDPYDYRKVY